MLLHLILPLIQTSLLLNEDWCFISLERAYQSQMSVMGFSVHVRYQNDSG